MPGVYEEAWLGILIKSFRAVPGWLQEVPQLAKKYINKNTIHLVDIGVDPTVLINNTTYPIPTASRTDADVPIGLDKLETTNTKITDDELHSLPYDKEGSVIDQHKDVLAEKAGNKSAHSLAPSGDTVNTPVILTTGSTNGFTVPRKKMMPADLNKMTLAFNALNIPQEGRVCVLDALHLHDMLALSESFEKQWANVKAGEPINLFGWKIYVYGGNPVYNMNGANPEKVAFGAIADPAEDLASSFFFYKKRTFQATGDSEMYYASAKTNPEYRETVVGFRQYHLCLPKKNLGFGAIVSAKVA